MVKSKQILTTIIIRRRGKFGHRHRERERRTASEDTETYTGKNGREAKGREQQPQLREQKKGVLGGTWEDRTQPCQHLPFGPLASRTVTE